MKTREFLVLLAMHCCLTVHGIKIAAYNVRVFGQSKLGNTVAMNMITQIVRQYDIIVIQEVRGFKDPTGVANGLLQRVNQPGQDYAICNLAYTFKPSQGSHREMYLFLYRPANVKCIGTEEAEVIDPTFADAFRRPPTVGRFETLTSSGKVGFFVIGIHTQPSRAKREINSLVDVYLTFSARYSTDFGFVMGDYNYGGTYVSPSLQDHLAIDMAPFSRFINKTDGTTVKPFDPTSSNPKKPYDRIYVVVPGTQIVITTVGIDTFCDILTEQQYFSSVSDHYPVYVEVNIGINGGNDPSKFPINQNEFINAVKEECQAVLQDYDSSIDDDLEKDFFEECSKQSPSAETELEL